MDEKGDMSKDFIIFVRIILLCQGRELFRMTGD